MGLARDSIVDLIRTRLGPDATLQDVIKLLLGLDELDRDGRPIAVPTYEEIGNLLAATENPRDRLLFRVLYATGIRVGEAVTLVPADLWTHENVIFVRSGKGDLDRYVLCDAETMRQLTAWAADRPADQPLFAVSAPHVWKLLQQWSKKTEMWQKYKDLGLRLSPHSLRHAFATHCFENGMSVLVVQQLLGHALLVNTEIYIHGTVTLWRAWYDRTHELAREGR